MNWLNVFKHLLPNARAWRITVDKTLRKFFDGLTVVGSDAKANLDEVYQDLDPFETRALSLWEDQFGLLNTGLSDAARRARLDATWKAQGGQDPAYIQATLQAAGFDVFVHEWWEPNPTQPLGGSVNGDVTPVARNPFDFLDDGQTALSFIMQDGVELAQDNDEEAEDGSTLVPVGYPLVNKILESFDTEISDGALLMQDGGADAQDGEIITSYRPKEDIIPAGTEFYPYFLYIGGETFPEQANIPNSRRAEFEDLCLKICPLEQWLGILVSYS